MSSYKVWIRHEIINEDDAKVHIMSPTAQFGLNVFEGIRCYWNEKKRKLYAFKLEEHIERLLQSCFLVGIKPPYSKNEIIKYFNETIIANNFKEDIAARIIIFGDGIGSWHSTENFSMVISPIKKNRTDTNNLRGLSACISSWERINDNVLPPRAKVGANYMNSRYGHLQAKKDGYDIPIFLGFDRKISEGGGACIFLIRNEELVTPSITSSILESITRKIVMEIASYYNIKTQERIIDRTELYIANEVFMCGTAAEISPIVSVDRFPIGSGRPGKITTKLLKDYLEIASGSNTQYLSWCTPVE